MKRHILHNLFRNILMLAIVLLVTIPTVGAAPNRGLAVPSDTLPAELKGVPVQDSYTGSGTNVVGEIQSVVGHVIVFREDKQYAYFAAPKDKLFERDVVYTLKSSRCRFQLLSSDIATLSENTRIMIKTYINNRSTGVKSTSFVMKKGKAMFYALRLFMYKGSSMEVETPTAVSGVRGTKWGMEVVEGKESASLPILVADSSDLGAFRQLAQANTGGGGYTIIHSFEGAVFVDSVPPGQTIMLQGGQSLQSGSGGLGNPYPTPPGTLQGLLGDGAGSGGDGGSGGSGSEGGGTGDGSTITPDTSSLIQGQGQSLQTRPLSRIGYYVGMLNNNTYEWSNTFISKSQQNMGANDARAYDNTIDYSVTDWSGTVSYMTELVYPPEALAGLPQPIQQTELGYNSYLTWGYWTQPAPMTISGGGSGPYKFINRGYYVMGDITGVMPTSISGTYSGIANGTVWSSGGTWTNCSGSFSMNVTFAGGTGNVSAFNVSVGNPAIAGASITGGTGTISGNTFNVTAAVGNVKINNVVGDVGTAYGSFYGPTGTWVGGVWKAEAGLERASGNFIGSKP